MHGYVEYDLNKFHPEAPKRPKYAPHLYIMPHYGAKMKMMQDNDNSLPLGSKIIARMK